MLVDAGWGGFNRRDAERIAAAAKKAGVKRIDYLVITHFHTDHVGRRCATRRETADPQFRRPWDQRRNQQAGGDPVQVLRRATRQRQAHRGETRRFDSRARISTCVSSPPAAQILARSAGGRRQAQSGLRELQEAGADKAENGQSVGFILQFGNFRLADLGDLTSDREYDLVCPDNKLGAVDAFIVSHHGTASSNCAAARACARAPSGDHGKRREERRLGRSLEDAARHAGPRKTSGNCTSRSPAARITTPPTASSPTPTKSVKASGSI